MILSEDVVCRHLLMKFVANFDCVDIVCILCNLYDFGSYSII